MFSNFINDLLSNILAEFISFVLKYIIQPIFWFVFELIRAQLSFYFYQVGVLLLTLLDFISDLFRMMAGLAPGLYFDGIKNAFTGEEYNGVNGETSDLLFQLITSEPIMTIFGAVLTLGLFLLIVSSLYLVVKQELNMQKSNNKMSVIKTAAKGAVYMILVPVICIFGVVVAQSLLKLMDAATGGQSNTISGVVFSTAAYDAFYEKGEFYFSLFDPYTSTFTGVVNLIINLIGEFGDDGKVDFGDVKTSGAINQVPRDHKTDGKFTRRLILDCYKGNNDAHMVNVLGETGDFVVSGSPYRVYYNSSQVSRDFNGGKINYLIWYMFAIILIKTYVQALFGLVQRLYKVVMLFLVMPGMIGMMPMDEGSAFSSWRKQFSSEVLGAFGVVIAMNIFMTLADIAPSLTIEYETTNIIEVEDGASSSYNNMVKSIRNYLVNHNLSLNIIAYSDLACMVMHAIFIMTGALMINKMSSTISSILGGSDMLGIGSGMMSEFSKTAGGGAKLGAAVAMGGLSMTRMMTKPLADKLSTGRALIKQAKFNGASEAEIKELKSVVRKEAFGASALGRTVGGIGRGVGAIKEKGFKGAVGGVLGKGAVGAWHAGGTAKRTLLSGIKSGAIFSPTAMKTLGRLQKEKDEADRALEAAKQGDDKKALGAAYKAQREKAQALKRAEEGGARAVAEATMEMNLQMAKEDALEAIPGMKTFTGLGKDFKQAKNDVSGTDSISGDLKDRVEAMKKDNANKAAEKRYSDILDKLHTMIGAGSIDAVMENMRDMYRKQRALTDDLMKEISEAKKEFDNSDQSETMAAIKNTRIDNALNRAIANGLNVEKGSNGDVKITPTVDVREFKNLEALKNATSKSDFDKQARALLEGWAKSQDSRHHKMADQLRKTLDQMIVQMKK